MFCRFCPKVLRILSISFTDFIIYIFWTILTQSQLRVSGIDPSWHQASRLLCFSADLNFLADHHFDSTEPSHDLKLFSNNMIFAFVVIQLFRHVLNSVQSSERYCDPYSTFHMDKEKNFLNLSSSSSLAALHGLVADIVGKSGHLGTWFCLFRPKYRKIQKNLKYLEKIDVAAEKGNKFEVWAPQNLEICSGNFGKIFLKIVVPGRKITFSNYGCRLYPCPPICIRADLHNLCERWFVWSFTAAWSIRRDTSNALYGRRHWDT